MNTEIASKEIGKGKFLKIVRGDITREKVDAIVNAANSRLQHGGGVAGAIVRAGGSRIQEESDKIGPVAVGEAAITGGGGLPAGHVIHAVGPRWGEGDEEEKLRNAVYSSLRLAEENHFATVSLPAISAGIFGFPKDRCAEIILHTVESYLKEMQSDALREVRICLFDREMVSIFQEKF